MNDHTDISACPRCGSLLDSSAIDGLCPRCLGMLNFDTFTTLDGTGSLTPAAIPTPEELSPFFPQFEILSCLGRGGMGVVYKARQKSLDRVVALKLLAPERASDPAFARRFAREARTLASLNHPHIVAIHDFGEVGGYFHLTMEFVDGENLRQLLKTKRLTQDEALAIALPICDALECAHQRGVIHRDIKPENLLIDASGKIKIADFGIAQMMDTTTAGTNDLFPPISQNKAHTLAVGTPDYASPEQREQASTDQRSDIYSLGVVLYEMLTGVRPDMQDILTPLRHAGIGAPIISIVIKALASSPDNRFPSAAEFHSALEQRGKSFAKTPGNKQGFPSRWRHPLAWSFMVMIIAALLFYATPLFDDAPKASENSAPDDRSSTLSNFEENFASLMEAKKSYLLETDENERNALILRIEQLEARDRDLRERIEQTSPTPTSR